MRWFVDCKDWDGESQHKYAHLKRDGIWVSLCTDQNGRPTAWSRTPRELDLSWLPAVGAGFNLFAPPRTVAYCELFAATQTGACLPRELIKGWLRDRIVDLRVECFAVEQVNGVPLRPGTPLDEVEAVARGFGLPFVPWRLREEIDALRDVPEGGEGWVLKDGNLLNWRKVKPRVTVDLLCVGFTEGKGKYLGMIGAMRLADKTGAEVTQVSGMTDEARLHMTQHQEEYIGKVVEVEAQARGSAGGLMHPRFNGVRDDKGPNEVDTL
jgi:hypothetical protein